jgi:hypothetical protein
MSTEPADAALTPEGGDAAPTPTEPGDAALTPEGYTRFVIPARPSAVELTVPIFERPPASQTPFPPKLEQAGPLRRFSPRKSWPEVRELDRRMDRLDEQRVRIGERIGALEQAVRAATLADKQALADWQLGGEKGSRPGATAPALEAELAQARADHDATAVAEDSILKEKTSFVAKHRKRLVADAGKGRAQAVARFREAIAALEAAREEVLEALRAEQWAKRFPGEEANADALGLQLIRGGRVSKAWPELRTITTAASVFAYLMDDAAWLERALADPSERPVDPHEQSIWEDSPEGREAMVLANERVGKQLAPRDVREAAWQD